MKIFIPDNYDTSIIEKFSRLGVLVNKLENADAIITRSSTRIDKRFLDKATKLKIVARFGVGIDNIDTEECNKRGIRVVNATSSSTTSVAELTICLIIMMLRNVLKAHEFVGNKNWKRDELVGSEFARKTLGIIGLGRIGSEVARMAVTMNADVIAYDPYVKKSEHAKLVSFDELLKSSDVISIHAPLTKETENLISDSSIDKMKDGVYFLNMARGKIVDEEALYKNLKSGKIKFAVLDVLSKEPYDGVLLNCDNLILTCHIGANTKEAQEKVCEELISKIIEN